MATMSESFTRMRDDFDRSHENRQQLIRDLETEVQTHAAETAKRLAEDSENRQAQFAAEMDSLRTEVNSKAAHTRGMLAEFAADLHQGGAVFNRRAPRKASKR